MPITINGSGTIGGPTTFTDNVTLGTSLLATPSGATPSYLCRAWVNFNGTGTVAIRASGNVSSITDLTVGQYQVNFATNLPDANYAIGGISDPDNTNLFVISRGTSTSSSCFLLVARTGVGYSDAVQVNAVFFR
jgi:hypothetical protein